MCGVTEGLWEYTWHCVYLFAYLDTLCCKCCKTTSQKKRVNTIIISKNRVKKKLNA